MNILIYSPGNYRAADQQAQAELLLSLGYKVYLLTWSPAGVLHNNFAALGAMVYSSSAVKGRSVFFFIKQAVYLVQFCKKNNIDIVFSNLQGNALVAGIAKYWVKARFFYIRHNSDYFYLKASTKDNIINYLANKLSPRIIAISNKVKEQLIKEGVDSGKIMRVNLCYNFNSYANERLYNAADIKTALNSDFLIIYIARLDSLKGHLEAFEVIKQLQEEHIFCKLLCIGEGDFRPKLEQWILENKLQQQIILKGFVSNVFDYIEAADLLLLLSRSEASNNAVKEAGMCKRTAIVYKEVGDFNDYIKEGENGFFAELANPVHSTVEIIKKLYNNRSLLHRSGEKLYETIIQTFSIETAKSSYVQLLKTGVSKDK